MKEDTFARAPIGTREDTFAHSPLKRMFEDGDVYGIAKDEDRLKKRPVRLAILGCGGVAQTKHIPAIKRLQTLWEPVELCAVCVRNPDQGRKTERVSGAKWYSDFRKLLDEQRPDGALVLASDGMHFEMTMECLARGIHVLVEKPLCRSLVRSREMVEEARRRGLVLMTVSNKRYSPPYFQAKKLISDGTLPNPAMFSGKFNLGYRYVDLLEGGTVHMFDLARYFMGDVESVRAAAVRKYEFNSTGYPFDNACIQLKFAGGSVGSIITSSTALSLHPWERVEIYGEKKWLSIEDQTTLTFHGSETEGARTRSPVMPNTLLFDEEFGGFCGLIENFLGCIRKEESPLVTGEDGLRAFELAVAVHLAADSGEEVALPLPPEEADESYRRILNRRDRR